MSRFKNMMDALMGRSRAGIKDAQLAAIGRPRPGTRVICTQDYGPPGFEETHGWLGLEGIVIQNPESDRLGALAVLQPVQELPFPAAIIYEAQEEADEVWFLWPIGAWREM